jgi:hypothetical protein
MRHNQQPTTIAILGADTLVEDSLARLLEREGYATRILEPYRTDLTSEPLDGVDVVLLAPGLKDGTREAFLGVMRSTPEAAAIPVLSPSAALKQALLDELSASLSWRSLFEELVGQIGAALEGAAASTRALVVDGEGSPEGISL